MTGSAIKSSTSLRLGRRSDPLRIDNTNKSERLFPGCPELMPYQRWNFNDVERGEILHFFIYKRRSASAKNYHHMLMLVTLKGRMASFGNLK